MAKEVYRVEIPIVIDDKTDAPLKQAERKINRFERSAQKTNERIRRIFGREVKLHIAAVDKVWPIAMKIQSRLRGLTSRVWKVTLEAKDSVTNTLRGIISKLTSPLALLGAGAGVTGAIYGPLKIAGEMEQARIAMDYFMGSAEAGKRALNELLAFAATTPFEFPALQEATIMLMGAGYSFDQAMRALRAFGDAAGMTGAGIQGMKNAMVGFTQIATAGTLNLQDLKQVTQNLRVPPREFAKELGVAEEEMGDIGRKSIPAAKAMEAIVRSLEKKYGGGMEKLSKSLLGLVSTAKDTAMLTVAAFGKGMAEPVKRILIDMLGIADYTSKSYEKLTERLKKAGRRVGEKFEEAYQRIKKIFSDISNAPGFNEMSWCEKVSVVLDKVLEAVTAWLAGPGGETMRKVGEITGNLLIAGLRGAIPNLIPLGGEIAKTLLKGISGWLATSPLGAALVGGLLGAKFGGFYGALIGTGAGLAVGGIGAGVKAIRRGRAERHQIGGIFTRPHIGLVAEAGPEAVIPLAPRWRYRAENIVSRIAPASKVSNVSVTNNISVTVHTAGTSADPDRIAEAIAVKMESVFRNMPQLA